MRSRAGLSMVEVALLLSVAGVTLAAAVPAFVQALRASKLAEASHQLGRMRASVASYYASPQDTPAGKRLGCLPAAAGPAPEQPSPKPVEVVLEAPETPGHATWRALGFELDEPVRYRYSLLVEVEGCGPFEGDASRRVVLRAEGDLDADGVLSRFELHMRSSDEGLLLEPPLIAIDRTE